MPESLVLEWNDFLNWELEQMASAIMSVIPDASSLIGSSRPNNIEINNPEEKSRIFDALGGITNGC